MTDIRETVTRTEADTLLRDYHEARRREEQWRIPQLLTALVSPILALVSVLSNMAGNNSNADIAAALAVICGTAAVLMAVEAWRWHRIATSGLNQFRNEDPAVVALLLKDPI
jgi:protein-S-isoprenylcysteine O-methyltransferase Ste14